MPKVALRLSFSRVIGAQTTRGGEVPVWGWILIIVLIVLLLGGFGYSRR
jgi:hypothetical protein